MKLANLHNRAVLITDGGAIDIAEASSGPVRARRADDLRGLVRVPCVRRDDRPVGARADRRGWPAGPIAHPSPGVRHRAQLPGPRRGVGHGRARPCRRRSRSSRRRSPARSRTSSSAGPTVDWEVELVAVIGRRADRVAEADGWVARRRADRRPGHLRAHGAVRRRQPVLARQVVPGLRPDGPVAGDARRGRPTPTTWPRLLHRRRDGAGRPHQRPDLHRARLVAELSAVLPLLPGDVIFTGTPAGVGVTRAAAALPAAPARCSRAGSRASAPSATGSSMLPEDDPHLRRRPVHATTRWPSRTSTTRAPRAGTGRLARRARRLRGAPVRRGAPGLERPGHVLLRPGRRPQRLHQQVGQGTT